MLRMEVAAIEAATVNNAVNSVESLAITRVHANTLKKKL
jgi:stage V sporulation protein SpoVS